ncbi:hypothetical protein [Chitinilyticum aquatile]|uniref:hypothetical protein n=1 Tax=Chitinilyticum aquatile TaxID=362520 RepID=UPI0004121820|nr:hypothetical protein [Chitinilyticum aquatile]
MTPFKFDLNQHVTLAMSGEQGVVIGRAEFNNREPWYFVRYVNTNGQQTENWQDESALKNTVQEDPPY